MERIINVAIASYGMSGRVFHGPSLKVLPNYNVVGVYERTKNNSKTIFPKAQICRDFDSLLAIPNLDLVVVNTPDHLHYEMTKKALLKKKHVVVEKPFTHTVEQAEELISLAEKNDCLLSVYQNRRYDGNYRTIKKLLESKMLGNLVECEIHYDRYRTFINEGSWKEQGDERVGVLFNLGSHLVDQVVQLFGTPNSITAKLAKVRQNSSVNDYMNLRLDYDYLNVILRSSYLVAKPGPMYTLHGTNGSFTKYGIDPQEQLLIEGHLPQGEEWGKEPKEFWGNLRTIHNGMNMEATIETDAGDYTDYYRDLYLSLTEKATNPVPAKDALQTIRILNAAVESHLKQTTIKL